MYKAVNCVKWPNSCDSVKKIGGKVSNYRPLPTIVCMMKASAISECCFLQCVRLLQFAISLCMHLLPSN